MLWVVTYLRADLQLLSSQTPPLLVFRSPQTGPHVQHTPASLRLHLESPIPSLLLQQSHAAVHCPWVSRKFPFIAAVEANWKRSFVSSDVSFHPDPARMFSRLVLQCMRQMTAIHSSCCCVTAWGKAPSSVQAGLEERLRNSDNLTASERFPASFPRHGFLSLSRLGLPPFDRPSPSSTWSLSPWQPVLPEGAQLSSFPPEDGISSLWKQRQWAQEKVRVNEGAIHLNNDQDDVNKSKRKHVRIEGSSWYNI